MLKRLRVQGFKSLADIEVEFPAFTVLFGPNAPGQSTIFLDASYFIDDFRKAAILVKRA